MKLDEFCTDCKEYDQEKHNCPRFNKVIRETLADVEEANKKKACCPAADPDYMDLQDITDEALFRTYNDLANMKIYIERGQGEKAADMAEKLKVRVDAIRTQDAEAIADVLFSKPAAADPDNDLKAAFIKLNEALEETKARGEKLLQEIRRLSKQVNQLDDVLADHLLEPAGKEK